MSKKILLISILCLFIFMCHNLENKKSISKKKNVGGMENSSIIIILCIIGIIVVVGSLFLKKSIINYHYINDMKFYEVSENTEIPIKVPS